MSKKNLVSIVILTLLYWVWESQAEGNIRIDLLVLYPFLFTAYIALFWKRFKFWSLVISLLMMGMNTGFFMLSYKIFNKSYG